MGVTAELTAIAVGIGVVGAAATVWSARRSTLASSSVLVRGGIAVALLSMVGAIVVLETVPLASFAVAHLLYLIAVVSVPVMGQGCAVAWVRDRSATRRTLAVSAAVLLLPVPVGLYATHVAPYRLREDRATLEVEPGRLPRKGVRVGVISDLQNIGITDYERSSVDRLMARKPDLIFLAGDMFQGSPAQFEQTLPAYRAMLERLHAPGGVYIVRGDVDDGDVDVLIEGTGIRVLDDAVTTARVRGKRITIGGTRLAYESPAAADVYRQLEATTSDDLVILVSHRPDTVLKLERDSRVDLVVAGHTHGGQIALPFYGPPVTLSSVPRSVAAGGLGQVGGNAIYVSTGVGLERGRAPQVRFLTRPSFGIIDLVRSAG